MQPSHKKLQASILQSQQFGKYLSIMAFDHEFAPRSQKSGNQIAENVEIGQKKMLSQKNDFWKTVAFSDETMLELNNDRLLRVRRLKNRRFEPQFLAKFNGFSRKKLMICGCIRSNGDKLLILIENKVDSDAYTKILTDHVIEFLFMHEPFQQNNVVAHTSLKTKTFFGKMDLISWKIGPLNLLILILLKIYGASSKERSSDDNPTTWNNSGVMPRWIFRNSPELCISSAVLYWIFGWSKQVYLSKFRPNNSTAGNWSKVGHKDLLLTTLLKRSGRFCRKGELRQNEVAITKVWPYLSKRRWYVMYISI